jgi:transcription antitermination factor NusG
LSSEQILELAPSIETAESFSRAWFAAYTGSCQEKRVAHQFSARNIEFFLPVYRNVSRWKNGLKVVIERPLFPSYVFVKVARNERVGVLQVPGVVSIVGAGREPVSLPTHEIETLRHGVNLCHVEPHSYLNVGSRARVCRGPLEGLSGIVLRTKNSCRLVLSLELIRKSVAVEVNKEDLEPDECLLSASLLGLDTLRARNRQMN